jgi:hypothetical protein
MCAEAIKYGRKEDKRTCNIKRSNICKGKTNTEGSRGITSGSQYEKTSFSDPCTLNAALLASNFVWQIQL